MQLIKITKLNTHFHTEPRWEEPSLREKTDSDMLTGDRKELVTLIFRWHHRHQAGRLSYKASPPYISRASGAELSLLSAARIYPHLRHPTGMHVLPTICYHHPNSQRELSILEKVTVENKEPWPVAYVSNAWWSLAKTVVLSMTYTQAEKFVLQRAV